MSLNVWVDKRVMVVLKDGYVLYGTFVSHDNKFVTVRFNNGGLRTVSVDNIRDIKEDKKILGGGFQ